MKHILYILIITAITAASCKKLNIERINKIASDSVTVANNSVTAKGLIVDVSEKGIDTYGHCWSLNNEPTISDYKTENTGAKPDLNFTSTINNVLPNTTYYVRAYAKSGETVLYGEIETFIISDFNGIQINTSDFETSNTNSFKVKGNTTGLGSLKIMDYGHCWATSSNPNIINIKTSSGEHVGDVSFASSISNVKEDTTYYVRSYVKINESTILYGNELTAVMPSLKITTDGYTTNSSTAVLKGTILSLGLSAVTDHGHCWSTTNSNPNINDNTISQGITNTTGFFYSNLSLTNGNTYYFRAYAIKGNTVVYGSLQTIVY